MTPADVLRTATRPIRNRSLESALIVVAVALGVGVVTAMLALILNGLEQEGDLSESLSARELIMVARSEDYRGNFTASGVNPMVKIGRVSDKPVKLEPSDLERVRKACPAVTYAYLSGYFSIQEKPIGDDASRVNDLVLTAMTRDFIDAAGLKLLVGSWPTQNDFKDRNKVIAVTEWFARQRFGQAASSDTADQKPGDQKTADQKTGSQKTTGVDARAIPGASGSDKPFDLKSVIGRDIFSKGGTAFKIIGVFAPPNGGFEFANDRQIWGARGLIPVGVQGMDIGFSGSTELKFLAAEEQFAAAREQLGLYASKNFGESVAVRAQREQIAEGLNISRNAALVTALFASGGLVIAALNITNLMLARVLGRTRSIGISSALGASSRTIFALFLTESLVLGMLGGLLGMLLAKGITVGLEISLKSASPFGSGMDLTLRPLHFGIGLLVALLISVLFGAYPAWMASKIRPSEALRG
jgi:ABC-type antimicrobial peptide transport system permease subunit